MTWVVTSLEKYSYSDLHSVLSSWPANIQIPKIWNPAKDINMKRYMSEVATLNFVTTIIRPNIQYTTNRLAEANKGPTKEYIVVLKYLWRYIVGTKSLGFCIGGRQYIFNLHLYAYGDVSFADDLFTRVSIRGYMVFLAGCPIIWKS